MLAGFALVAAAAVVAVRGAALGTFPIDGAYCVAKAISLGETGAASGALGRLAEACEVTSQQRRGSQLGPRAGSAAADFSAERGPAAGAQASLPASSG